MKVGSLSCVIAKGALLGSAGHGFEEGVVFFVLGHHAVQVADAERDVFEQFHGAHVGRVARIGLFEIGNRFGIYLECLVEFRIVFVLRSESSGARIDVFEDGFGLLDIDDAEVVVRYIAVGDEFGHLGECLYRLVVFVVGDIQYPQRAPHVGVWSGRFRPLAGRW